ncbi:MAG: M1 family metallopeptidase [Calditrichia bacterium]
MDTSAPADIHSFSRPDHVKVTHIDLDISVDFEKKEIAGQAALHIENITGGSTLIVDTRDLTIEKVIIDKHGTEASFTLGDEKAFMGRPLTIDIKPETDVVVVHYHTSPEAGALQWLAPEQTAGKKQPFLFTQSQAILARTWVPCQDSPGVRITYNARVKTSPELMAVMSAENGTSKTDDGVYTFQMTQPIPSYLLALAVGDLEYRALGPTSGVYAEPSMIEKSAYEFADVEKMIQTSEALYGKYRWGKYDIIVLPPSFPFGGMENPRLTFATPTILAGDRSLTSLIAHELAHSWSGNLVTNATWNDFWLNEGFTVYFENRIMEALYGEDYARMLAQLGYQDCLDEIADLGPESEDTHLFLDLSQRDPDDGMTNIAYEKGRLFLKMLEDHYGREKWDAFLLSYFNERAFKSTTTDGFLDYLNSNLIMGDKATEEKLRINDWIFGPGLPDNSPIPKSGEFAKVEAQIKSWTTGTAAQKLDTKNWTTHHWLHFLRNMPKHLTNQQMADLDKAFNFTESGNSEIQFVWYTLGIRNSYQPVNTPVAAFLQNVGRRKFIKPLYETLAETPAGLEKAREIYKTARSGYHPVTYLSVDPILGFQN